MVNKNFFAFYIEQLLSVKYLSIIELIISTQCALSTLLAFDKHCLRCIGFHSQAQVKLKVVCEELLETLGMAVYIGGGPSLRYAAEALEAFEEFNR